MTEQQLRSNLENGAEIQFSAAATEQERTVPHRWIELLAQGPDREIRVPIRIKNAIIEGDLDLSHVTFKGEFSIRDSAFLGSVNVSMAVFERTSSFENSSVAGPFACRATRFAYDFELRGVHLHNETSLMDMNIGEVLSCEQARFEGAVYFDRTQVGKAAVFAGQDGVGANFGSLATFHSLEVDGHLVFGASQFNADAIFDGLIVRKAAFFDGSVFFGRARFNAAHIGDQISLKGVLFKGDAKFDEISVEGGLQFQANDRQQTVFQQKSSFAGARVPRQAAFVAVDFGPTNFLNASFGSDLIFAGCAFNGPVCFDRMRVGSGTFFDADKSSGRATQFSERVTLVSAKLGGILHFEGATFSKEIILSETNIDGAVQFQGNQQHPCRFLGAANFAYSRFIGGLGFVHAQFHDEVDFLSAEIGKLVVTDSFFDRSVSFRNISALGPVVFQGTINFKSQVDMSFSRFQHELTLSGCDFENAAIFDGIRTLREASFVATTFGGSASFVGAEIGSQAAFQGATFSGYANFNRISVGGSLLFRLQSNDNVDAASFRAGASFVGSRVSGELSLRGVHFMCTDEEVRFDAAEVGKSAVFVNVSFAGIAKFHGMKVKGQASFMGAHFMRSVSFDSAIIEGRALFREVPSEGLPAARFAQEVDFRDACFGSTAEFVGVTFSRSTTFERVEFRGAAIFLKSNFLIPSAPNFKGTKFRQGGFFQGCRFEGGADFSSLEVDGEFRFCGAVFSGHVDFESSTFDDPVCFGSGDGLPATRFLSASFSYCHFERIAGFSDATFGGNVTFREADLGAALFNPSASATEPQFSGTIDLRGCRYRSIDVNWRHMLSRDGKSSRLTPVERQPYSQLESVLKEAGRDRDADDVYLERRTVERRIQYKNNKASWLANAFYWRFANYGIRPYRLIAFALVFISFGVVLYHRPGATKTRVEAQGQGVWRLSGQLNYLTAGEIAFRKFLPVDLPLATDYEPTDDVRRGMTEYAALLKLMGWIIVPVGVAALAGLLRRAAP